MSCVLLGHTLLCVLIYLATTSYQFLSLVAILMIILYLAVPFLYSPKLGLLYHRVIIMVLPKSHTCYMYVRTVSHSNSDFQRAAKVDCSLFTCNPNKMCKTTKKYTKTFGYTYSNNCIPLELYINWFTFLKI